MNFRTIFPGAVVLTLFSCLTAPAQLVTILHEDFNDDDDRGTQVLAGNTTNTLQVWPPGEQRNGGSERFKTGLDFSRDGTVGAGLGAVSVGGDTVRNNLTFGSGFSRQRAIDDGGGTYTVMIDMYKNAANEAGMELRTPDGRAFTFGWGGPAPGMGGNFNLYDISLGGTAPNAITVKLEIDVDASGMHTGTYSYVGVEEPSQTSSGMKTDNRDFEFDTIRIQMNGGDGTNVAGGYDNILITYLPAGPAQVDRTWNNTMGDSWFTGPWINGTPGADNRAIFGGNILSNSTVIVDSPVSVTAIRFDNGVNSYVIAGSAPVDLVPGTTLLPGDPEIEALAGTHEFQARVNLGGNTTANISSGATVEFNNRLDLNSNTLTKTGAGTLAINNNVLTGVGTVNCQQGTCGGTGTVSGDLNNNGGTVSPGNSPGILTVDGNYTQNSGGTLALEIGGLTPGQEHDKLVVTGTADLNGTVAVELIDGFTPANEDQFDMLDFAAFTDSGYVFDFSAAMDAGSWDTSLFETAGTLCFGTCVGGMPTDFDDSGFWDLPDLNLVLFNWQQNQASLPVEWVNQRPDTVGLSSLNMVLFNWQQASTSLAAVPEPSALVLFVLAAWGFLSRVRSRHPTR